MSTKIAVLPAAGAQRTAGVERVGQAGLMFALLSLFVLFVLFALLELFELLLSSSVSVQEVAAARSREIRRSLRIVSLDMYWF
jgi:Flp pilus assembly protein TadG